MPVDAIAQLDIRAERLAHTMSRVREVLTGVGDLSELREREELFSFVAGQLVDFDSDRTAPVVSVGRHVGNYWRNWLLIILRTGPYRPSTISRLLAALDPSHPISQRMLTLNLRVLERDGLIGRRVIEDERRNVEYTLTPLGRELSDLHLTLVRWGLDHSDQISSARAAFDADPERAISSPRDPRPT